MPFAYNLFASVCLDGAAAEINFVPCTRCPGRTHRELVAEGRILKAVDAVLRWALV